MKYVKYKSS